MALEILWTQRAGQHFKAELRYYGNIRFELARELRQLVKNALEVIASTPGVGRPGKRFNTREYVFARYPYIIAYRVSNDVLEILAFIHQKRKNIQSYY